MNKDFGLYDLRTMSYVLVNDGKVRDVGYAFCDLTGYSKEDFLKKTENELFKRILKTGFSINCLECNHDGQECYLFTKTNEARHVTIRIYQGLSASERIILFTEIPDTRLEDKFPFALRLCADNYTGVAIYSAPELRLLKANSSYLQIIPRPDDYLEDMVGLRIEDFMSDWEKSASRDIWIKVLETGSTFHESEYRVIRSNGKIAYYDYSLTPITEAGVVKHIIVMLTDVTEKVLDKKRIEEQAEKIKEQKEQLEAVINNMTDALLVCDNKGEYILCNRAAKELIPYMDMEEYGFKTTQYYNMDGSEASNEDMPIVKALYEKTASSKKLIMKRPDKTIHINVTAVPICNEAHNVEMVVTCTRDITDIVKYEELLKRERDYLYKILENIDLPIMRITYPDFIIKGYNKKSHEIVYSFSGVRLIDIEDLKPGAEAVKVFPGFKQGEHYRAICEMGSTKDTVYVDSEEVNHSGEKTYRKVVYQPLLDAKGEIEEFLIITIDVTSEVRKKEEMEKAMRLKDEFFSFISHEFKTPLTVINAAVQTLQSVYSNEYTDKVKGFIQRIRQNSFRQLRLVNNLLDITRAESGYLKLEKRNLDIVLITKVITESVVLFAKQKGVYLEFTSKLKEKVIAIDEEKYERILLNLLSNAIKFTPEGKGIVVKVSLRQRKVCVEVKDQGIGIPKDKLNIIFDRFGQISNSLIRTAEGTGLGLSLVKLLVSSFGGEIQVASVEGKGSTFRVLLPIEKVEASAISNTPQEFTDKRLIQSIDAEFSSIYLY